MSIFEELLRFTKKTQLAITKWLAITYASKTLKKTKVESLSSEFKQLYIYIYIYIYIQGKE